MVAQIPCICYCSGWAKIHVRRPTGDTCWVTRVLNPPQSINDVFLLSDWSEEPAPNLAAMLLPHSSDDMSCKGISQERPSGKTTHTKLDRSASAAASLNSPPNRRGCFFIIYVLKFRLQYFNEETCPHI